MNSNFSNFRSGTYSDALHQYHAKSPTKLSEHKIRQAANYVKCGGLIAYPTEAVYGLGCHPLNRQAILKLLQLKQRPIEKGLILIAANFEQLLPYIKFNNSDRLNVIRATWPGPITWLFPAHPSTPRWLSGNHHTIAVRVTGHPIAARISKGAGTALVSTSANKTGFEPARTALRVRQYFKHNSILVVNGAAGNYQGAATAIFDAVSGQQLR